MRFMAIIGFCLVAIMALVRDVNPPAARVAVPEASIVVDSSPKPLPKFVNDSQAVAVELRPAPGAVTRLERVVVATPKPIVVPEPTPGPLPMASAAEMPASSEEGLSLRFDSDRAFLRLVTSREVGLYLFNDESVFRLNSSYAFRKAPAAGQLYELMLQTMPSAIRAAADAVVSNTGQFRWGVAMPAHIERRIAALVALEHSGQLVVDRFGAVRHEPGKALEDGAQASISGGQR